MVDPVVTDAIAPISYYPFDRAVMGNDLRDLGGNIGVTGMVNLIRNHAYISYEFTGSANSSGTTATARGFRAASFGPGWARSATPTTAWISGDVNEFRWINFITGKVGGLTVGAPNFVFGGGDTQLASTSIRDWYKWGARKFWLHHPFGRVSKGRGNQEASHYQVDAYYSAKHGCTCPFGGTLGNTPMPWLTDDVVDGITQGFVPLFKALITGSSADLSPDMWWRLTGTGADTWYDPNDPIEVVVYNGTINQETFRKWRRWFESSTPITNTQYFGATGETEGMPGNAYARYRLEQSFEPFRRAGMRLGLDAIPQSPGPVPTLNANPSVADMDRVDRYDDGGPMIPQGITYGAADEGWWKFFSEYVLKHWRKSDIFMEAHPETIEVLSGGWQGAITGYTMNPYQKIGGINIVAGDEYTRQGFGGSPNNPPFAPTGGIRAHYLGEYGQVEYLRSPYWSQGDSNPTKAGHVGTVIGGVTAWDGHYWYLREIAQPTTFTGSLPNLDFENGDRYLRAVSGLSGYQGTPIWGAHVWGDHLIRYQYQKNDQTTPEQNKTIPGVLMNSTTLRSIPASVIDSPLSWTPLFGITYTDQFSIKYPKIQDYAKFLANVYAGGATMTLKGATTAGHPVYNSDVDSVVVGAGAEATLSRRIDGVSPVLFLDPYEWDTFAQTNLRGMKPQEGGGSFYTPTPDVDLPQGVLDSWLDMKVSAWKKTFGQYPKYIAWKMTKDTRVLYSQLVQFQMDRFLYNPNSVPLTPGENSNAFSALSTTGDTSIRRNYFALPPYWNSEQSQGMLNQGYQIGTANPNQSENSLFTAAKTIVNQMLERTKAWRDKRKFTGIKVGLDNFPYIPEVAYSVYSADISGVISLVNEAYWNDEVFPREKPRANVPGVGSIWRGGQDGWLTPAETEDLKKCIRLEYRKRLEPIANACEFVMPEVLCKTPDDIPSDPLFKARLAQQQELADLCYSMKVNQFWSTTGGPLLPAALTGKPVLPVTSLGYGGATADVRGITLNPGDPVSTAIGTLFDKPKFNRSVIDPLRDNYFRPVRGIPRKIDGLVFRNDYDSRVFNAMSTQSYAGRTADRQWVIKWLAVDMGSGATVDWNNPTDVENKIDMFFDIRRRFTAQFADRFDRGQPRIDVTEDPYEHDLFAASWHNGYRTGLHPEVAEGITISDVVPSIFPGHTYGTLLLRTGGQTSIPTAYFNETVRRIRLIPEGRRVVIPYFWHEDPVADQSAQIDHWKATSDGVTYTGTVPYRLHETPGTVKFNSPWAYEQTAEAATSIRNFISDLAATGAYVDYIADDAEAWGTLKLSSVANAYAQGFGPTGMPAPHVNEIIQPLPSWRQVPDPRQTPAIVADPRFANLPNSFNEKSMAQIITEELPIFYNNRTSAPTPIRTNQFQDPAITGLTAAQFLHFYIHEGGTGISGATGGPTANFGDTINPNAKSATNPQTPWRAPWAKYNMVAYGKVISPYLNWYAHTAAIEDFVMGDLVKKCWVDTIAGFTNERIRGIGYSHYAVSPTGITEGMLVASDNGHPPVVVNNYPWIDAAPELYGELASQLRNAKYMIPSDYAGNSYRWESEDFKRHQFASQEWKGIFGPSASDFSALPTFYTSEGTNPITNESTTGIPARSYIALIKEMQRVRATLRYRPDAWKRFNPWLTLSVGTDIFQHGWRGDQTSATNIWDRTTPEYGDELVRHCIVSGARHINYFFRGGTSDYVVEVGATGYTGGLIAMQNIISEWKSISGGLRAQPVSTADGSPNTLQERIVMADVGGNHAGATGILMSGCKLLKYDTDRKSGSNTREEDWIWRLTAAPQAKRMYLQSGGDDLPPIIDLVSGSTAWFVVSTEETNAGGFTAHKIGQAEYTVNQIQGSTNGFIISTGITQATRGNGGVELRHHAGISPTDTFVPLRYPFGRGRPMEYKFYTKKVSGSFYDGRFTNAITGASASIAFVGFYDFVEAFGNHNSSGFQTGTAGTVVSSSKPFFGLKSGLGFSTVGGSYGRTHIAWYDESDAITPYKCSVIQYPESSTSNWFGITFNFFEFNQLGIQVEPDGSEARFLLNGQVIRSITAGTVDASGKPIRIPTAEWTEDGRGLWAGAVVRDMTLEEGIPGNIPGAGGPPESLFIWSDGQNKSNFTLATGENDVFVKPSRYGAWIKRKSPVPPVYKISDVVRDDIGLDLTPLEVTILGTSVTKSYTITGINTEVDIQFSFSEATYAIQPSQFTIRKNGIIEEQTTFTTSAPDPLTISVNNEDSIDLEFNTSAFQTNFTITLTNVTTGDTIGVIPCFYGGEIPEIQDASDYEVWASSWIGDILVVPPPNGDYYNIAFPYTQYTATNTNVGASGVTVDLKAIVPAISLSGQYSTDWNYPRNGVTYGSFNGYRRPDDYASIGETDVLIEQLKTRLNYSPPGRRVYKNRFLSSELFYRSRAHLTTLMDSFTGVLVIGGETIPYGMGYTYEYSVGGTTYSAFIADLYPGSIEFQRSKGLVALEASKLANAGVSFEWFLDDHESQQYWHLFGLNSENYWGMGICAATGLPIDPYGTNEQAFRSIMPDARLVSGLAQNPIRGYNNSDTVHPVLGISFGKMFVQNYRDLSGDLSVTEENWKTFIAPLVSVTGATAYLTEAMVWTDFPSLSGTGSYFGYDRNPTAFPVGGFTYSRFVAPAWDATVDMFHHGGYLYEMYNSVYGNPNSNLPYNLPYKDVKFMQYDIHPIEPQEVQFTSYSNMDKMMQRRMPSSKGEIYCSAGSVPYAMAGVNMMCPTFLLPSVVLEKQGVSGFGSAKVRFELLRDGKTASNDAGISAILGTQALPYGGSCDQWNRYWGERSGYIQNPVTDSEKYTWQARNIQTYHPIPAFTANQTLVRYPLTSPYASGGETLEPLYGDVLDRFWNELSYKYMVNYLKQLRLTHRSDTDLWKRWCPWIADPGYESSIFARGLTGEWIPGKKYSPTAPGYTLGAMRMAGLAYWYEQTFHDILHGAQHFQHYNDNARVDRGGIGNLQNVLDEWRRVSNNSRAQPVVASVAGSPGNCGALGATIDRITLWEAFEKPIISGALLLNDPTTNKRVWRVTAAPHHFDYANNAYLRRTDTNSAFPAGITLNRYVGGPDSLASLIGGRGTWLITETENAGSPSYRFADRRISPINNLGDIRFLGGTPYQVAPDSLVTITGPSGPEAPVWFGLTFSVGGTYPTSSDKFIQARRNGIGVFRSSGETISFINPETTLLTFTGGSGDTFEFAITDSDFNATQRMDFNVSLLNITDPVAPITLDTFRVAHWYLPNNSLYDGTLPDLQPTSYGSAGATSSILSLVGFDYPNPDIIVAVTFGAGIYPKGNGPWSPSTLVVANTGGFGLSALVTLPANGSQPDPLNYQGFCILNKLGEGIQLTFSAGGDTADFPVSLFRYSPREAGEPMTPENGIIPVLLDTFQCRFTPITTIDIPNWNDLSVLTVTSSAGATVDTGVVLGGAANAPIALGISFGGPTLPQANDARITMSWPGGSTVFAPNTSTLSSITTINTSGVTTGFVVGQGVTFAYTSFGGRAADFNMSVFNRSNGDQLLDTIACGFDHDPVVDTPTWTNLDQFTTTTSQTLKGFNCPVTIRPSWSGTYSVSGTISNALIIRKNGVIVGSGAFRNGVLQPITPTTFTAYPGDLVEFEWSTNQVTSASITVTVSRDSFPQITGLLPFINPQTLDTFTLSV